jgi:phosphoglycolate phosphatase-like HAD superfamily hydrolase
MQTPPLQTSSGGLSWEMLSAIVAAITLALTVIGRSVATTINAQIERSKNEMLQEFRKTEAEIAEVRQQFGVPLAALTEKVEGLSNLREKVDAIAPLKERLDLLYDRYREDQGGHDRHRMPAR